MPYLAPWFKRRMKEIEAEPSPEVAPEQPLSVEESNATPCDWHGHRLSNHQWHDTVDGYQRCANCKNVRHKPAVAPRETQKERWECFSDMSYYDMWAVRPMDDKRFQTAFHVSSKQEAEALRDLLNVLEGGGR